VSKFVTFLVTIAIRLSTLPCKTYWKVWYYLYLVIHSTIENSQNDSTGVDTC